MDKDRLKEIALCVWMMVVCFNGESLAQGRHRKGEKWDKKKIMTIFRNVSFGSIPPNIYGKKISAHESSKADISIGNKNCPNKVDDSAEYKMDRSVCPWYFQISYDQNRRPETMAEAACSCKQCLFSFESSPSQNIVTSRGKCKPIFAYPYVLRRENNSTIFQPVMEKLAVGCTCVFDRVQPA